MTRPRWHFFAIKLTGAMWPRPPSIPSPCWPGRWAGPYCWSLPLGIVLYLTGEPRLLYAPRLYRLLSLCVNVLRFLPFIILLIVHDPADHRC